MFRNYIKTAWRNIARQKGSTIINVAGLTLGISCSLVLFLMVSYLSSFDNFHSKGDRIFRVVSESQGNQGTDFQSGVPSVLPNAFKSDFPEAEEVVFTSYRDNSLVLVPQRNAEPKKFQEERGVVYTEPAFFRIFDRKVLEGDAQKALDDPNEAVIAEGWAKRYFGHTDVIGETVKFDNAEYKIAAIVEDAPSNTDLPFELFLSYVTIKQERESNGWHSTWSNEQCYFLAKDAGAATEIERRLGAFGKKYVGDDDFDKTQFRIQPLKDLHHDDRYDTYTFSSAPKEMLIGFSVIAIVLIVTACINFINLTTAEAIKRSKEVGVRKCLGSSRGQLIRQFLGETTLITVVSVLAAIGVAQLALSFLNRFLEMELALDFSGMPVWAFLGGVTVVVSVLSGLYPAFVISGFKPVQVLKNQMTNRNSSSFFLRRVLVVLQFVISQLLIIVTIVIIYQMDYTSKKDLGFVKDAILMAPIPEQEIPATPGAASSKMRTLREQMLQISGVEKASLASFPPSSGNVSGTNFSIEGVAGEFGTQVKQVDGNYLDVYGLKLAAGRNLQDLDTAIAFVVNEQLAKTVGFKTPDEIIGREIKMWGKKYPVVGVVKDFHTVSLHQPIEATILLNRIRGYETLALKVDMRNAESIIGELKKRWEAAYPEYLFSYEFLDQHIAEFYDSERRISTLLGIFSSIAVFIGCLGLFGLATFMANQKNKEIGVRKVLGASVEGIIFMFSKEYVKLILLGFLFAVPLGWFAMNSFLSEFTYKVELGAGIFALSFLVSLMIALLTVGYRSFKAAVVNPVKSLRYE